MKIGGYLKANRSRDLIQVFQKYFINYFPKVWKKEDRTKINERKISLKEIMLGKDSVAEEIYDWQISVV